MENKNLIVFIINREISPHNASFSFGQSLIKTGYDVEYWGIKTWERYVKNNGFNYILILDEEQERNIKGSSRIITTVKMLDVFYKNIEKHLQLKRPSLVVLHSYLTFLSVPILKLNIPIVQFNADLATKFSTFYPPVFTSLFDEIKNNRLYRLIYSCFWLKLYLIALVREILISIAFIAKYGLKYKDYNYLRNIKQYGGNICFSEFGFRLNVPEIVACSKLFDFPNIPDNKSRIFTGLGLYSPIFRPLPDIGRTRNVIYCSLGSHINIYNRKKRIKLYKILINLASYFINYEFILQIWDNKINKQIFEEMPKNVTVTEWVNQYETLSKSKLFITHGGMSSIKEAIFFNVPMIVFPCKWDQFGNAARIKFHKIGINENIKTITFNRLRRHINSIFENDTYCNNIQRMKDDIINHDESNNGINLIKSILEKRKINL